MIPQPQLLHAGSEPPVVALSPGKRLQHAREIQGLSQADIANSLRLPLNVIKALEEDQHDGIHATYLKGYLRSYARLVGVSTDLVVADIRQTLADRQAEVLKSQAAQTQMNSSHKVMKLTTLAVCTLLLGLGVTWWRSQKAPAELSLNEPVEEPGQQVESVPLIPTLAASEPAVEQPSAQGPSDASAENKAAVTPPKQIPSDDQPAAVPSSQPIRDAAQPATSSTVATAQTSSAEPVEAGIVVRFNNDSWTEIADAVGKRLYKKLAKRGETVKIAGGRAPYRIKVGNGQGISLYYDGKVVDLSGIAHNGVSRFRIESDGRAHK